MNLSEEDYKLKYLKYKKKYLNLKMRGGAQFKDIKEFPITIKLRYDTKLEAKIVYMFINSNKKKDNVNLSGSIILKGSLIFNNIFKINEWNKKYTIRMNYIPYAEKWNERNRDSQQISTEKTYNKISNTDAIVESNSISWDIEFDTDNLNKLLANSVIIENQKKK
jgi:hypothetical protein